MIGHSAPTRRVVRRSRLVAVLLGLAAVVGTWQAYEASAAQAATFGNTSVGGVADNGMLANHKIVHVATLPVGGSVTKLSVYAIPGINSPSPQALKAVIYSDSGGSPGSLLATGTEVTYRGNVNGSGWLDLPLASPVSLSPGTYWLGFIAGTTTEGMGYRYNSAPNSRAYNANSYTSPPTSTFGAPTKDSEQASIYATYTPAAPTGTPANVSLPTISGSPKQGQQLTSSPGAWSNSPTAYSYQWLRCNPGGASCSPITLATTASYTVVEADVGRSLRVAVSASNVAGSSPQVTSAATARVPGKPPANAAPPTISGTVQQGHTLIEAHGSWASEPGGLLYMPYGLLQYLYRWQRCDSSGNCAWIIGAEGNTYVPEWRDIGDTLRVQESAIDANGAGAWASSAASAPVLPLPPQPLTPPRISGSASQGQVLSASPGTWLGSPWVGSPTGYSYQWSRCNSTGAHCAPIATATSASYTVAPADVNAALRVTVVASSAGGPSPPSTSGPAAVVGGSAATRHLEYVLSYGNVYVYDMDQGYQLVKTISLPETKAGIRGVSVAPGTHLMFISYGGDGGAYGNGSVLAYDLVSEKVAWTVHLSTGIDSGSLSPDGRRLYMPTGENTSSGIWNILDTSNGSLIGTIQGGGGAHNTIASADGRYVYLGNRNHNYLDVYETSTGKVREVGPLVSSVRPFTVNGSNTLAFTTATGIDGFQVSSLTTGKPLFTVSFAPFPSGYQFSTASHGIALTPDEKQAYVIDTINKEVRVYDVSRAAEGVAPTQLGVVPVAGLSGTESPCAYDCGRSGWIQASIDGRFMFIGDSGEVIETATRKVLASIPTLLNTKVSIEVEWANGVPVATSTRSGVGKVG